MELTIIRKLNAFSSFLHSSLPTFFLSSLSQMWKVTSELLLQINTYKIPSVFFKATRIYMKIFANFIKIQPLVAGWSKSKSKAILGGL
jgi:hypothetical protein